MGRWDDRLHVIFLENVRTTLQSSEKVYKTFLFSSIFFCFFYGPLDSKHEVTQKAEKGGGSNKSVTRLMTFLEVSTKFENTNNSLFPVLLLRILLESISNREERRTFE